MLLSADWNYRTSIFGAKVLWATLAGRHACEINHDAAQLKRGSTANGLDRWEPEPSPIYCATELLWGVSPMTTKTIDSGQERSFDSIAREQFDAFEDQERLIREEERAARAAQLNLPMQISTRLRAHKKRLLKKGRLVESIAAAAPSAGRCRTHCQGDRLRCRPGAFLAVQRGLRGGLWRLSSDAIHGHCPAASQRLSRRDKSRRSPVSGQSRLSQY